MLDGIRCVAFDAVGTLIFPRPPVVEAYRAAAARYASRYSADELRVRFRQAFARSEENDFGRGATDWNRLDGRVRTDSATGESRFATSETRELARWQFIVGEVIDDASDPVGCFQELWEHFARPNSWACFPDVAETIAALERAGIELAIASNFDARLRSICDGLPPLDRIKTRVISSEAGWRKPAPQFFRSLATAARCRAEEILLVGDDRENDFVGAQNAGLRAVWLRRGDEVVPTRGSPESESVPVIRDLRELIAGVAALRLSRSGA